MRAETLRIGNNEFGASFLYIKKRKEHAACLYGGVEVSECVEDFSKVGVLVSAHYVGIDFAEGAVQLQL